MAKRTTTSIRLPGELRKRLEASAKKHKRSLTAEIEYLTESGLQLEESIHARETAASIRSGAPA